MWCFLKAAAWWVSGAFVVTGCLALFVGALILNEHYRVSDHFSQKEAESRGYWKPGWFLFWSVTGALFGASRFVTHFAEQITGCG